MANINVNDISALHLSGTELFNDSESFMTELSDESEQMAILGGCLFVTFTACGLCTQGDTINDVCTQGGTIICAQTY
ncbi:MAG: hypothetical protein F6K55_44630 [Moorea sp. SIO4A3]|nr:hypothetical protein [Moorena sp. SIO4A3]